MERDTTSISLITALCFVVIVLLIIALIFVYMQTNKKITELENKATLEEEKISLEVELNEIKASNGIAKNDSNKQSNILEAKDENVQTDTSTANATKDTVLSESYGEPLPSEGNAVVKDGYLYYSKNGNEEPKKVEGVSNIKYLNVYNIGTGVNKVPFVVTEDGVVYRLNSQEKLVKYEELSTYQVDKILSHEGEMYDVWTILLKEKKKKIVEVKDEL